LALMSNQMIPMIVATAIFVGLVIVTNIFQSKADTIRQELIAQKRLEGDSNTK
jgi:uncharacterized membrane protein YcaP (DUF421 family)